MKLERSALIWTCAPKRWATALRSRVAAREGIIQRALAALRDEVGDELVLIADTCLCEYTDHGHCGHATESGEIDNDRSLEMLAETAVSQARAGADIVAPSAMMDGQVHIDQQPFAL